MYTFLKAYYREIVTFSCSSIAGEQMMGVRCSLLRVAMMGEKSKEIKELESMEYAFTFRGSVTE